MRSLFLVIVLASSALAQSTSRAPVIGAGGFVSPFPLSVAPGQVVTLFLQNFGDALPSDITAVFHQNADIPMPVLDVRGICSGPISACAATVRGVTVQVPYGIQTFCPLCANPLLLTSTITVSVKGVPSTPLGVQPLADQVHFLTQCDVIVATTSINSTVGGLPCPPVITHADGTPVNFSRPAKSGEELVAYATGLGEINPTPAASPTRTVFGIDFNFRPNALATKPAANAPAPVYTGATAGFVGLYQINFTVPPIPADLAPCVDPATIVAGGNVVQSNLTVSVGSNFSFDGAGICVQ